MADEPALTVLMCARNEEGYISSSLRSLCIQDIASPYEIVVVDNNSSDKTSDIARTFTPYVFNCAELGKVPSLKKGFPLTRGEIIAMADADTIYPPDWLSSIKLLFHGSPKSQLVFGSSDMSLGKPQMMSIASYLCSAMFLSSLRLGVVCSMGFNMAVRRKALQRVLDQLEPMAMSGWAIGTLALTMYGRESIVYSRTLQVPKCMRRYQMKGFAATLSILASEWVRLALGRGLRLKESEYYEW